MTQTEKLYTLNECAAHVKRTPELLRAYFSQGMLPDPPHTTITPAGLKQRRFTYAEMEQLKKFFKGVTRNSLKPFKTRAERRKRALEWQEPQPTKKRRP